MPADGEAWRRGCLVLLLTAAIAVIGLVACGGDEDEEQPSVPDGVFVGTVEDSDAYIGLISDGDRVSGYLCDGDDLAIWLDATPISNGSAELTSRRGARVGTVELSADKATGEIAIDDAEAGFTAEPAEGEAGVYRAASGDPGQKGAVEAGWVVLPDGSQRGAMIIGPAFTVESVQPLETKSSAISLSGFGALSVTKLSTNFTTAVVCGGCYRRK